MTAEPSGAPTRATRPASIADLAKTLRSEREWVHQHAAPSPGSTDAPLDRFESAVVFAIGEASRMRSQQRSMVVGDREDPTA